MVILITPHAVNSYRERVFGHLTDEEIEAEIRHGLHSPLFRHPAASGSVVLYGCRNPKGHPFVVACDPAPEEPEFLLVRTVGPWYFWHEIKPIWKQYPRVTTES